MKEYLYIKEGDEKDVGIIVLPEIFGVNGFVKSSVDRLNKVHNTTVVAVDFYYPFTGESRIFSYDDSAAHEAMDKVRGEKFSEFFSAELDALQKQYPFIKTFAVVGYCFGGKLVYVVGIDPRISKIVSYYGGRVHYENFFNGRSALEAFIDARKESPPEVLALFGENDASIPEGDRATTKEIFNTAGILYREEVYEGAGHAFCNHERSDRFHTEACAKSIIAVDDFLRS